MPRASRPCVRIGGVKILVLGSGGREHAFAWRLQKDPDVSEVICAPGNPGMAQVGVCVPLDLEDPQAVLALAEREQVDLTIVGPEAALGAGVADAFEAAGRAIIGPSRAAAQLETSKVFAKDFMARHDIPTARFAVCRDLETALDAISGPTFGFPVVVKADGLAAGKGVTVAQNREEAEAAVRAAMVDRQFGASGAHLVIEEYLEGAEISLFLLCDGYRALPLATAQDHKRIWDDDRGPNTGGMGAFAPSPLMHPGLASVVMGRIVRPVLEGMRASGHPYRGFLYVGLMLTASGPKVIEFNVRFGDPEAQVIMPFLDGQFARTLFASATSGVEGITLSGGTDRFVGVVLATPGYPGPVQTGQPIEGLERAAATSGVLVFHAATKLVDGQVVTAGGRVLTVVGRGSSYESAMRRAYKGVAQISFEGMQYRHDIGRKAVGALI
jgi:phosphoribosylamine--glycine ligase